ncbi:MAG: flavoprotein [Candidatus Omnitrophota bacterium]|nr:flavoprotein [Candidatus Omnitrophota bacterium]
MKKKEIIVGVCGSIAAYKAVEVVNHLTKTGINVRVIMTDKATRFVGPLTFQTMSGNPVAGDLFDISQDSPPHISLVKSADLILICPATANIIGKLAGGIADDLLSSAILASKIKVFICPAMNERMYNNKIVQSNIGKLKALGYRFIGPRWGRLACGYEGKGHLAGVEVILKEVKKILK